MDITKELLQGYRSKKAEIQELDYILKNRWRGDSMSDFEESEKTRVIRAMKGLSPCKKPYFTGEHCLREPQQKERQRSNMSCLNASWQW